MARAVPNKNNNPVTYIHVRKPGKTPFTPHNNGGMTIAFRQQSVSESSATYEVGVARCRDSDNFCRKIGRKRALGNLNFDYYHLLRLPLPVTKEALYEAVTTFAQHKYANHHQNQTNYA